ncbi:hypothetical protein J6590_001414 [Homalodisca vitripennis]|nr:hypothetical protein J6590_095969 [Homalodisca vitripennis]KAG8323671.1 hypothetical protein J6590_001414 [Homalodisca vitripennis]
MIGSIGTNYSNIMNVLTIMGLIFLHKKLITTQKQLMQVDEIMFTMYEEEVNYWQSILSRIVLVVRFLAVSGLVLQDENEDHVSTSNGLVTLSTPNTLENMVTKVKSTLYTVVKGIRAVLE